MRARAFRRTARNHRPGEPDGFLRPRIRTYGVSEGPDAGEPPTIVALDEETVDRIAAGEVVERPASVVKELLENSLDADARRIDVRVENGGTEAIRVRDDGIGMGGDALRAAVQQHTTSKLRSAAELEAGIDTYGFRGEALHAIGTVARLTITSRPRGDDTHGHQITLAGGDDGPVEPAGCPPGTTVEVADLFYNTPARREFLAAPETEFDHVNRIVTHYALANPDTAISLTHNDREVFSTPGRGDVDETLLAVYGREVADAMESFDVSIAEGPVERVSGAVSEPTVTRSSPRYVSTFVNDRYVKASAIREAIIDAYGQQLAADRYPFAVVRVSIADPAVDVNVHPRKLEVRFDDPDAVQDAVRTALGDALDAAGRIPTTAPRGPGRPADTAVSTDARSATQGERSASSASDGPSGHDRGHAIEEADPESRSDRRGSGHADADGATETAMDEEGPRLRGPADQRSLTDNTPRGPELHSLPTLTVLGQVFDTYIVAETSDELLLIDQHAADERIAYERLLDAVAGTDDRQALMSPVTVSLTSDEAALYDAVAAALTEIGFETAKLEDRTLEVRTVPAIFDTPIPPERVRDAIHAAVTSTGPEEPIETITREVLADLACNPAVTGNTTLAEGDVVTLLTALDACENPYECPHGRPVVIRIDEAELEERFERTYPGHGARRNAGREHDDQPL